MSKETRDKYRRGLGKDFLVSLEKNPLNNLIRMVLGNNDLTIQIRNNYLNIYYLGGNVAKINSARSVVVDENYFRSKKKSENDSSDELSAKTKKNKVVEQFKKGNFEQYLDEVIKAMSNYWTIEPKGVEEKKAQHKICILNNADSEFYVLDLEFEISKRSDFCYKGKRRTKSGDYPTPRFDIIAVRKRDGRLCVIELKKGVNALSGKSGVQEHAESFINTIGASEDRWRSFVNEMKEVLSQKKELGFVSGNVVINDLQPEFLFAYQEDRHDKKGRNLEQQKECFKHYMDTKYKDGKNYAKNIPVLVLKSYDYKLSEDDIFINEQNK